jgi:hypothetical protein
MKSMVELALRRPYTFIVMAMLIPSGPALKLLDIVERKGLKALA